MTRVDSDNYNGDSGDFRFAWATADTDRFDRVLDLYNLARAVELHDHTAGKGLAVARLANLSVTTANLQSGAVTATKLDTDAVTAVAVQLDAIGALELADNSVDTNALQNDAVTADKIADGAITGATIPAGSIDLLTKGTYVPVNKAGDINIGNLTGDTATLSFKGLLLGSDGLLSDLGPIDVAYYLGGSELTGEPSMLGLHIGANGIASQGPMSISGQNVLKSGDATVAAIAGGLPRADAFGKIDAWVTGASTGVPSGFGGWVPTAGGIPSGYTRYNNLDGRMPIGAGTTFSVTYTENTPYGASWFHAHASGGSHGHSLTGSTGDNSASGQSAGTGTNRADSPHQHSLSTGSASANAAATSSDNWQIPVHTIVWIRKN